MSWSLWLANICTVRLLDSSGFHAVDRQRWLVEGMQ